MTVATKSYYNKEANDLAMKMQGEVAQQIFMEQGEGEMILVTNGGSYRFICDGDCCSETWFADIIGLNQLIGATIAQIQDVPMPDDYNVDDGRSRQEEDSAYGFRIDTDKGSCLFAYRNSSNGYYGGDCYLREHDDAGFKAENWYPIMEDWSA